jgi:hypothetical protein
MIPLDHVPLYSPDSYVSHHWTAQRNTTGWNIFMGELVAAGNSITELMLSALAPSLPGAHIGELAGYDYISFDNLNWQACLTHMGSSRT